MALNKDTLVYMYDTMLAIRGFENRLIEEVSRGNVGGAGHSYVGQEAVATGVSATLRVDDYVGSTHRGHGHTIAKGVPVERVFAELFGKATGTNKGKGGSMHLADMSRGMMGTNGVVGNSISFVTGAGLSAKVRGTDQVAVCFFGDGASNQGILHESMNLASIWKLPVLFVCENNGYAQSTPAAYSTAVKDIATRAAGYDMPSAIVDGQDIFTVHDAAAEAVQRARSGQGPTFIEAKTYRYQGHYAADNHLRYRTQEEVDHYKGRDCIERFKARVLVEELLTAQDLQSIEKSVSERLDQGVEFAMTSPFPELSELLTDVYAS